MSFMDLVPPRADENGSFSRIDNSAHAVIDQQISEFIAMGGGITSIPIGASSDKMASFAVKNEFDPEKPGELKVRREKGIKGAAAMRKEPTPIEMKTRKHTPVGKSGHTNIISGELVHSVIIANIHYGSFPDLEEALDKRDSVRKKLGMKKLNRTKS